MQRLFVIGILIFAFCGLADASYLTQHEVSGAPIICNLGNLSGCNAVADSPYSDIFGIPVAAFGVFFYGVVFVLSALELFFRDWFLRRAIQAVAILGLLASLYFTFLQIFVIQAFCIYCLASALASLFIALCAWRIEPMHLRT